MTTGERAPLCPIEQAAPAAQGTQLGAVVVRRRGQICALARTVALGWLATAIPSIGMAAAEEWRPAYAPRKVDSPFRTDRAGAHLAFPGNLPKRGALVATGNALSPEAGWIIVDLDARTIHRATTRLSAPRRTGEQSNVIEHDTSRSLIARELEAVVRAANAVWATRDPASTAPPEPTDALCSVALFDGNDMLYEFGVACPRAPFVQMLATLAEGQQ